MFDIEKQYWLELIDPLKKSDTDRLNELFKIKEIDNQEQYYSSRIERHISNGFYHNCQSFNNSEIINNTTRDFWLSPCIICNLKYLLVYLNEKIDPLKDNGYHKQTPNKAIQIYKENHEAAFDCFNKYVFNLKNNLLEVLFNCIYRLDSFKENITKKNMVDEEKYISENYFKNLNNNNFSFTDLVYLSKQRDLKFHNLKYLALSKFFQFDAESEITSHECDQDNCLKCYIKHMINNYPSYVYKKDGFYWCTGGALEGPIHFWFMRNALSFSKDFLVNGWQKLTLNFVNDIANHVYGNKFNKMATIDDLIALGYNPKEEIAFNQKKYDNDIDF